MTEEALRIVKNRREAKVKGDKSRVRILNEVLQQLQRRRTIIMVNVRRQKRTTQKEKHKLSRRRFKE